MNEQWRKIKPGYMVSSYGRVIGAKGSILKPWKHRSGHLYVALGKGDKHQVHRLVIEAFGEPQPHGTECRHLDGNPTNNHISNLAWGTRKENIDDHKSHKDRHAKSKFSFAEAAAIRALLTGRYGEQKEMADKLGVSVSTIHRIANNHTYA